MTFQEFSKNYLNILMVLLFQHSLLSLSEVILAILILDSNDLEFAIWSDR